MNPRDFVKTRKNLSKSDSIKQCFNYGDKISMFKTVYKVVDSQENGQTILEDEKNSRFALTTSSLKTLKSKGLVTSLGAVNLTKAEQPQAKPKTPEVSTAQKKEEPVGATKQGADGKWYKKTGTKPSKWIAMHSGTSHKSAGGEEHHPLHEKSVMNFSEKFLPKMFASTHPDDHGSLQSKYEDYVHHKSKFENMRSAMAQSTDDDHDKMSESHKTMESLREGINSKMKDLTLSMKSSRIKKKRSHAE